jgi:hypothetical protein
MSHAALKKGAVEEMNPELARVIGVDEFCVCYHNDADGCDCRKPLPGLLWLRRRNGPSICDAALWLATAGKISTRYRRGLPGGIYRSRL